MFTVLRIKKKVIFSLFALCISMFSAFSAYPKEFIHINEEELTEETTTNDQPGKQVEYSYTPSDKITGYLVYLPKDYNNNPAKKYPLVVFFHGAGERGTNLALVKKFGPPKMVEQGKEFPFILVSPQARYTWDKNTEGMDAFIEKMKKDYRVDDNRLYVTGLSMGGAGTWNYTLEYSHKVAAAVPICGWGQPQKACNMKNVPVWATHNQGDPTVGVGGTLNMISAIKSCSPNPEPIQIIYLSGGHDAWSRTYNDQAMWDWLLSQSKSGATPPPANKAPVANAGGNKTLTLPNNSINLVGSGSDADGTIASFQWTKVSGPNATMTDANKSTLKLTNLVEGSYKFKLTITDNKGAKGSGEANVNVLPNVSTPPTTNKNGLLYSYYEGSFNNLPDFSKLNSVSSGYVNTFDLSIRKKNDNFAVVFEGKIDIATSGNYTFYTNSDDGSKLYINNKEVVNNDGLHGNIEKSGSVSLSVGQHEIKVAYFDKTGGEILGVHYAGPGVSKQVIPEHKLYKPEVSQNNAPTANAGADKSITLPANSLTITGIGTDSDGTLTAYQWTKVSGPSATISDANKATVRLTNLVEGSYIFKLTVTDNDGATAYDEVKVTVNKAFQSPAPDGIASENGLLYSYYEGTFDKLPDFSKLNTISTGYVNNFDLSIRKKNDFFAVVFEGKIEITNSGAYTFYLSSDDGSKLYINNKEVVNNDGLHSSALEKNGSITLNAGFHDIKVAYFERTGGEVLIAKYSGPGVSKQVIPSTKLYKSSEREIVESPNDNIIAKSSILINFNDQYTPNQGAPWNNIGTRPYENLKISNLKDNTGKSTSISIAFLSKWGGSGSNASASGAVVPTNVSKTYFWTVNPQRETLKVSGLDKNQKYAFTFYGFKSGSGNNTTEYTIGSKTVSLNAANNTSQTGVISGVSPDANGNVLIYVKKQASASFGYLNSLIIETASGASTQLASETNFSKTNAHLESAGTSKVYPNPVIDNVNIELYSSEEGYAKFNILNLAGNVVGRFDRALATGQNLVNLDLTSLPITGGIFVLTIELPDGKLEKHKLVKN